MSRLAKTALAAALLAGLAACGRGPDPGTPQGQCEAAAAQDKDVQAARQQDLMNRITLQQPDNDQAAIVLRQKVAECLRVKGLAPPGGVQRLDKSQ